MVGNAHASRQTPVKLLAVAVAVLGYVMVSFYRAIRDARGQSSVR